MEAKRQRVAHGLHEEHLTTGRKIAVQKALECGPEVEVVQDRLSDDDVEVAGDRVLGAVQVEGHARHAPTPGTRLFDASSGDVKAVDLARPHRVHLRAQLAGATADVQHACAEHPLAEQLVKAPIAEGRVGAAHDVRHEGHPATVALHHGTVVVGGSLARHPRAGIVDLVAGCPSHGRHWARIMCESSTRCQRMRRPSQCGCAEPTGAVSHSLREARSPISSHQG